MDLTRDVSEKALMIEMGLTAQNIEHRKKYVGLGPDDLTRIGTIKELVQRHGEEFTTVFFNSLSSLDEAKTLLASRELLDRARRQELAHLLAMVSAPLQPRPRAAGVPGRVPLDVQGHRRGHHAAVRECG
jgi:Protoglobin